MNKMTVPCLISSLLCIASTGSQAQEAGQVLSRTAVYQQVAVPRQTCIQNIPQTPLQTSGGGALVGAITGGLIGSQLGGHNSQGLATMAGVIGGAVLGHSVESQGTPPAPSTTCTTQSVYENRLIGYNVVYEYAGKQYNVQLPQDPGPTIPLQVTPIGAARSELPTGLNLSATPPAPVVAEPRVIYVPTPVYRSYPPVYTSVNLGWGWGGGHFHRHWR